VTGRDGGIEPSIECGGRHTKEGDWLAGGGASIRVAAAADARWRGRQPQGLGLGGECGRRRRNGRGREVGGRVRGARKRTVEDETGAIGSDLTLGIDRDRGRRGGAGVEGGRTERRKKY
jgi:hypothetical protein